MSSLRVVTSDGEVIEHGNNNNDDIGSEEPGSTGSNKGSNGEIKNNSGRPDECNCTPISEDLPCWPCYRDGFEEPNPNVGEGE